MRVFVDTNVLFPFSVMDLMLALTEDSVHEVVWSERLLAEWERVIVREGRRSAESAAAVTRAIRGYFGDCEVAESDYAHLVDGMPGEDPDDRHHAAAACAAGAVGLITWNLADSRRPPWRGWVSGSWIRTRTCASCSMSGRRRSPAQWPGWRLGSGTRR